MSDLSDHMAGVPDSKTFNPRDLNDLAKLISDIATGNTEDRITTEDGRDLAAVLLGRLGGLKGGNARAAVLSAERRREIAQKAAKARWGKNGKTSDETGEG